MAKAEVQQRNFRQKYLKRALSSALFRRVEGPLALK